MEDTSTLCKAHNKIFEFYCSDCSALICPKCVSAHLGKGHSKIIHITEYCESILMKSLKEEVAEYSKSKEMSEMMDKELKQDIDGLLTASKKVEEKMKSELVELENNIHLLEVLKNKLANTSVINSGKTMTEKTIEQLDSALRQEDNKTLAYISVLKRQSNICKYGDQEKMMLKKISQLGEEIKSEKQTAQFIVGSKEFVSHFRDLPDSCFKFGDAKRLTLKTTLTIRNNRYASEVRDPSTGIIYQALNLCCNTINVFNSLKDLIDNKTSSSINLEVTNGCNYFAAMNGWIYYQSNSNINRIIKANTKDGKVAETFDINENFKSGAVIAWGSPSAIALVGDESKNRIYCIHNGSDDNVYLSELMTSPKMSLQNTKKFPIKPGFIFADQGCLYIGKNYNDPKINYKFSINENKIENLEGLSLPGSYGIISHVSFYPQEKLLSVYEYYNGYTIHQVE